MKPKKIGVCKDGIPLFLVQKESQIRNLVIPSYSLLGNKILKTKQTSMYTISQELEEDETETLLKEHFEEGEFSALLWQHNLAGPFPKDKFQQVMKFFQEIYDRDHAEAAVYLLYHPTNKTWEVLYPLQVDVSGGSVTYISPESYDESLEQFKNDKEKLEIFEIVYNEYNKLYQNGYRIAGTIHSHCNFNAFHSGIDDHDEEDFNGLHITIGKVRSGFDYSARYIFASIPFATTMDEVFGDEIDLDKLKDINKIEISKEILNRVFKRPESLIKHSIQWSGKPSVDANDTEFFSRMLDFDQSIWDQHQLSDDNSYDKIMSWSGEIREDHKENVWSIKDSIILFHPGNKETILAKLSYYRLHSDLFDGWITLPDPDPDDTVDTPDDDDDDNDEKEFKIDTDFYQNVIGVNPSTIRAKKRKAKR